MYHTNQDAMEYVARAIDGCGENPALFDLESIVAELYLINEAAGVAFLNRWDMNLIEPDQFWPAVIGGRYIVTVAGDAA